MTRVAAILLAVALAALPARADAEHPTRAEVLGVYALVDFRNALASDPEAAITAVRHPAVRDRLTAITAAMTEMGSGADGWRYLVGASVYAMTGIGAPRSLVMFYNPWVDIAVIAAWEDVVDGRRLVDLDWLPGDLLRGQPIEPQPAWARAGDGSSQSLIAAMAQTVEGFETTFATPETRTDWRNLLSMQNRAEIDDLISPLLAYRVFEGQLRLWTLANAVEGEDPVMEPLRRAIVSLIATAETEGFAPLLNGASSTPGAMTALLARIEPKTLQGLSPIAFAADRDEIVVYFISRLTADFALAAHYRMAGTDLDLDLLDFIPYAATLETLTDDNADQPRPGLGGTAKSGKKSTILKP